MYRGWRIRECVHKVVIPVHKMGWERLCYIENTGEINTHKMENVTRRVKCVRV